MKRVQDTLYDIIDTYTGENFNYSKVTIFSDGTAMDDTKADGIIYRKLNGEYFKRNFTGAVNVKWFGAKGDGVTDDYSVLQNILDKCALGLLSSRKIYFPCGLYLISNTLRIGNRTTIFGESPGGFPYYSSRENQTIIEARFGVNQDKFIIDSNTKDVNGNYYPVDNYPNGAEILTNNSFNYGINIKNIYLSSDTTLINNATYGGIRLIGTPTSNIENVSILNTKVGYSMVTQWGSSIKSCFSRTHWYGLLLSTDLNGNNIQGYFIRVDTVDLIPLIKSNLIPTSINMSDVYHLDAAVSNSSIGLAIVGEVRSTNIDVVLEHWEVGVFEVDAKGTNYQRLYLEGSLLKYALSTCYSSSNISNFQCYSTNDLCYGFDFGFNSLCKISGIGLIRTNAGLIKKIDNDPSNQNLSQIIVEGRKDIVLPISSRLIAINEINQSKIKALFNFIPGNPVIVKSSFNINEAVIGRDGAGQYTIYFLNDLGNLNYTPILTSNEGCIIGVKNGGQFTYSIQIICKKDGVFFDPEFISLVIY
jgi:hypothetical protein